MIFLNALSGITEGIQGNCPWWLAPPALVVLIPAFVVALIVAFELGQSLGALLEQTLKGFPRRSHE